MTVLLLSACAQLHLPFASTPKHQSHGPSTKGYGPVAFGTPKDKALESVQARGGALTQVVGKNETVLTYHDTIDVQPVRVVQHFDAKNLAAKAEVFLLAAEQTPKNVEDCRALHAPLHAILQSRYGEPDWAPRVTRKHDGESGVMVYTFADSSSITLRYDFVAQETLGQCSVKLLFDPAWASG